MNNKNIYLLKKQDKKYTYLSCPNTKLLYENGQYKGTNFNCKIVKNRFTFFIESYVIEIELLIKREIEYKTTRNGFVFQYNDYKINGLLKHPKDLFLRCNNRFIALMESTQIPTLLINPLVGYNGDNVEMICCNYNNINDEEIEFELVTKSSKSVEFEIYSYTQKLVFDNMIENIREDRNNVFTSVAFLENRQRKEELMIRFNYIKISELLDKNVEKAFLYIKILSKSKYVKLQIEEIQAMWCSFGTTWLKKPNSLIDHTSMDIIGDYLRIDVTKYIESFTTRKNINHPGFTIRTLEGNITLVTADSYYYPNILEVYITEQK